MSEQLQEQGEGAPQAQDMGLLDEIVELTRLKPGDEGFGTTRTGLKAFLKELVGTGSQAKVSPILVDNMLADIDRQLSQQVNAIMHSEPFQKMERAWRGLKYLVDNTDFRQNIKIEFVNASKQDLLDDFEDAPEVTRSSLYKHIYCLIF